MPLDPDIAALSIKRHEKYRAQWERDGKCNQCGGGLKSKQFKICARCRRYHTAAVLGLIEDRKKRRVCVSCAGALDGKFIRCAPCRAKVLATTYRSIARKKARNAT
jgi:hypothetical protein